MSKLTLDVFQTKLLLILVTCTWVSFLGLCSQIMVPLFPVPITGQIFAFLLLGLFNTPVRTWAISISYIGLGLAGLPLFHGLSGTPFFLLSPTFGYILGFPILAIVISLFKIKISGFFSFTGLSIIAIIPCYLLGLIYLGIFTGFNISMLWSGFIIFLPGEMIKISLAYITYSYFQQFKL